MADRPPERHLQLIRQWQILMELMRNPNGRHYGELAKSLRVTPRTIYRDLHTLERAGFPVVQSRIGGKEVWKLTGKIVPPILFSAFEIQALTLGVQMIRSNLGSPLAEAIDSAYKKIRGNFDTEGLRALDIANARFYARPWRPRLYDRQEVWFKTILDGLDRCRTVWIKYYTEHRQEETAREVDPYGIVLLDGIYYMVGLCHLRNEVRTFRVDRITHARTTDKVFRCPENFSAAKHVGHAWGILNQQMLTTVKIKFDKLAARGLKGVIWHETQHYEDQPDGSVIMTVRVAGLNEIKRWILGFGSAAEVLEPSGLRGQVALHVEALHRKYSGDKQVLPKYCRGCGRHWKLLPSRNPAQCDICGPVSAEKRKFCEWCAQKLAQSDKSSCPKCGKTAE